MNAALEALALLGVEETPIVSLAKREEEIYLPEAPEPLKLKRDDPGLRLLQEIRDESHRFAVSRHRARRSARTFTYSVRGRMADTSMARGVMVSPSVHRRAPSARLDGWPARVSGSDRPR